MRMQKGVIIYLATAMSLLVLLPVVSAASDPKVVTFTSPNAQASGEFGFSVAVNGDAEVVGAPFENAGGFFEAGHAYIFDAPTGSLIATLTSPNAQASGFFGSSVAVSGTNVIIGALGEAVRGFTFAGHAYLFSTAGSIIATLTSPNAQASGEFGRSVAVGDASVVVGASDENASGFVGAGHAYVFSTAGSMMTTLASPNAQTDGEFGRAVAVSSTSVVVGAPTERPSGLFEAGNAYIFSTAGSSIATLTSANMQLTGFFGNSVAVSGTRVVVGAPGEVAGGISTAGHAYIFSTAGGPPTATLTSSNAQSGGDFGLSVTVSVDNVIVGAPFETVGGSPFAGHAYTFDPATGSMDTALTSPNSQTNGEFGLSVASADLSHTALMVGAPRESPGGFSLAGNAYLYTLKK